MNRKDFKIISNWISDNSFILDLGCGEGDFLAYLNKNKESSGYGIEKDILKVSKCVQKNVQVIQGDFNICLSKYFKDNFFDYVVLNQTIQENEDPSKLIKEMLRVSNECIVTFPNMAFWYNRFQLGLLGKMPMSKALPNSWYDTPNIHLCTFKDFENLCDELDVTIVERLVVNNRYNFSKLANIAPNFFGEIAIYKITN